MRNKCLYILYLIYIIIAGFTSCTETDVEWGDGRKALELRVQCSSVGETRADGVMGGEHALNEDLIKTLHYFLYKKGETSGNALFMGSSKLEAGTQDEAVIRVPLNDNELNEVLFPRPANECEVYVIANLPDDVEIPSNTSVDNLKAMVMETDFKGAITQSSFVMDGLGTVQIVNRNKILAAAGEVPLARLAAKFSLRISVAESFTDKDGVVWTPVVSSLAVSMWRAASRATLSASVADGLFDYDARGKTVERTETVDDAARTFQLFHPFYSYPRTWEFQSEDALSFSIVLPWKCTLPGGDQKFQNCYYRVFPNTMQLERNNWYNMDLNIGVLGSFSPTDEPVVIDNLTYKVVDWKNGWADWSSGLEMETDLLGAYYLIVEQNEYALNNKDNFSLPFITSHECIIRDLKVTVPDFGNDSNPTKTDRDITSRALAENWLTLDGNVIRLNHKLNNDFINTSDYDYAPYTFTFILCHKNEPEDFKEELTIIQYPAITIEAHLNSDYAANPNNKGGYQFVNGRASNSSGSGDYGGAHGLRGNNTNPNMYVITTTVLPAGSDFVLGDPREEAETNPLATNAAMAPGVEGGANRRLSWYHKTITGSEVQNMISPKFRIASSYGVTNQITHQNAINRAASYQEDGYPAGRWRVPTMAEVRFIIKLSSDGKIPTLFSEGSKYWCANGSVTPQDGGGYTTSLSTTGNGPVRCVYDDWYWERSAVPRLSNYTIFTWGDEKSN